jgi:hypothetical protein
LPERLLLSFFNLGRRLELDADPDALDDPFKFKFNLEFEEEREGLPVPVPDSGSRLRFEFEFEEVLRSKCRSESGIPWALASSRRFT